MRKHWVDNLRWATVLLVPLQHILYMFNSKGTFGSLSPFVDDPMAQPQDVLLYIMSPWKMMLLFLLAGMTARYSLEHRTLRQFVNSRTVRLLVPATLGLFVYQWITGYFNILASHEFAEIGTLPLPVRWVVYSLVGFGPLWFVQDLWLFSLLLLLIRRLDPNDKFRTLCARANKPLLISLALLVYAVMQVMVFDAPTDNLLAGAVNLYRPVAYFTIFLLGYFLFANDRVLEHVRQMAYPMLAASIVVCIPMCYVHWGANYSSPEVVASPLTCLYAWLTILAMMGLAMRWADFTNGFCAYMNRVNYGVYVLHYAITISFAYLLHVYLDLTPWVVYPAMFLVVYGFTPILYEIVHRIPILRWVVMGEKS